MAKKINFIVLDRTTLQLDEDAKKGDIIDLEGANKIDENKLEEAIERKAWDKAEEISNIEITKVKSEFEVKEAKLLAEIKALNNQKATEIKTSVLEEKSKIEKQNAQKISDLEKQLALAKQMNDNAVLELKNKLQEENSKLQSQASIKIADLEKQLALANEANKNAVDLATAELEKQYAKQINALQISNVEKDAKLKETEAQWQHRFLSTKSYGEELEQFVYQEFEAAQQNGAFPNAKFWKDTEVISSGESLKGTKGDFVFKDYDDNGNEILTIEIEVKTEQSTASTSKTHNKDHFKKLNDDRIKKNCEYAILISELEKTNKNFDGIYSVRDFKNMYVVRPQSFLGLISILKNSLNKNRELVLKLNQHDAKIKNKEQFIENLKNFKKEFDISKVKWEKHLDGIEETIQDAIDDLTDTLEHIRKSRAVLTAGQNKVEKISVRKLLKGCTSEDDVFDIDDENNN